MPTTKFNIPYDLDLVKAESWEEIDKNRFFIVRFHFHIIESQAEQKTYPGEIIGSFKTPNEIEIVEAIEKVHSETNIQKTICNEIIGNELTSEISSKIKAGLIVPPFELSSAVGSSIKETLSSSNSTESHQSNAISDEVKERFEVIQKIQNRENENYHAVACYLPMRCDVHLHYIDFLVADYSRSPFGLRKKKKNYPRPIKNAHQNIIMVNQPFFSIYFWKLLPKSSLIYSQSSYQKEKEVVIFPEKIKIEPNNERAHLFPPNRIHPDRPTLFTLSNIAFPYRWIDRKGEWTMEELLNIEMDEVEGSSWWFQNGPGKRS